MWSFVKPRTREEMERDKRELDKMLQQIYESKEKEVDVPEPTVFDNFEEPHVEGDDELSQTSFELEDGREDLCVDEEEHNLIAHEQSISREYLDHLLSKTIDHKAERIKELAAAKEHIIDFMKEMHKLSLKQEEERHKRRLEQDKERLLLYREYTLAIFETMVGSPKDIKKQDTPGSVPFGSGQQSAPAHHKSEQSHSCDRKKRKVYSGDSANRHHMKPRRRAKRLESDKENSFDAGE